MYNDNIADFFREKSPLELDDTNPVNERDLQLAVIVMMISLGRQDTDFCPGQGSDLAKVFGKVFSLPADNTNDLVQLVSGLSKNFDKMEDFFESVAEKFSEDQRLMVISMIWTVATQIGVADRMETTFATVLKNRLNLSSEQSIKARQISASRIEDIKSTVVSICSQPES